MRIVPLGRKLPEEEHQRRLALHHEGLTNREIAAALGLKEACIGDWAKRSGLKRINKRKKHADDKYCKLLRCNDPLPPDELVAMKRRLRAWAGI